MPSIQHSAFKFTIDMAFSTNLHRRPEVARRHRAGRPGARAAAAQRRAWKGLCPFHGEKTPSFQVNGDKGFFHCFGCGVGGDVIKFVELYDKVTFPEAVRQLAARVGLTVPEPEDSKQDAEGQRDRETLLKVHEVAAAWFREQLATPAGAAARRQLQERGADARRRSRCSAPATRRRRAKRSRRV